MLILSGASIVLLQAALITALLLQRAGRRSAERAAVGLTGRLLTAHEDERRRLARELHDDLTQRLARLAIDAGKLERNAEGGGLATGMRKDLVRLSEDVHALSYRLHPSVLDDLGLVEALRAECDRVERHGDLRVGVDARDVPETLPIETSLCLFRVAQEALNNAVRHAGASAVSVRCRRGGRGCSWRSATTASGLRPRRLARPRQPRARQHARARPASARRDRHREHAGAGYDRGRVGARVTPPRKRGSASRSFSFVQP